MQKEIFLDVVFASDFCMDFLFLYLLGDFLKMRKSIRRLFCGAAFGAGSTCFCLWIHNKISFTGKSLLQVATAAGMVYLSYRIKNMRKLIRAVILLYLMAFWGGGFWRCLSKEWKITEGTFILFFIGTFLILKMIAISRMYYVRKHEHIYSVRLSHNGRNCCVQGLGDTGNRLQDPILKQPVSVIVPETIQKLLPEETYLCLTNIYEEPTGLKNTMIADLKPHFIFCNTIAGKKMLLAITIEKMCIQFPKEDFWIFHPVLAISMEPSTLGKEYQMILNSELLDGGGLS